MDHYRKNYRKELGKSLGSGYEIIFFDGERFTKFSEISLIVTLENCFLPLRKYDVIQEAEAECLGACLRIPQKALYYHLRTFKKGPDEVASFFNASKDMVGFRVSTTGISKIKLRA